MDDITLIILIVVLFVGFISVFIYHTVTILQRRIMALETATIAMLEIIADTSKLVTKCARDFKEEAKQQKSGSEV